MKTFAIIAMLCGLSWVAGYAFAWKSTITETVDDVCGEFVAALYKAQVAEDAAKGIPPEGMTRIQPRKP